MRVLCCLDGINGERINWAVSTLLGREEKRLAVLYVTDTGPREEMERHRERFLRPPHHSSLRREMMRQAEIASAQEILEEGERLLGRAERLQRVGRPEREIIQVAREWGAELILICSRSELEGMPLLGPKSVGHIARFVLDHAPCPVLLLRPSSHE